MENGGYKEIEDYVDYDVYGMIGARSKKLPNGDKDWFTAYWSWTVRTCRTVCRTEQLSWSCEIEKKNFDDLVEMLDYYNDEWDVKSEESF